MKNPSSALARSIPSPRSAHSALLALIALLVALPGCAELQRAATLFSDRDLATTTAPRPVPPHIAVADVRLAEAPSNAMLAAYYCTEVAPALVCSLIGPVPTRDQIRFVFDVSLDVRNDNAFPLPLVELLAAFTAFPDATGQQNLGTACLAFGADGAAAPGGADQCRSTDRDIRGIDDFARATANFLVAVAQGQDQIESLRVRTLAPNAQTRATVRLALNADVALAIVRTLATDAIDQAQHGRVPQFAIPYQFEGTAWVNVEHFGRLAATVPAFRGTWTLQ